MIRLSLAVFLMMTSLMGLSNFAKAGVDNPNMEFIPNIPPGDKICSQPDNYCGPIFDKSKPDMAEWHQIRSDFNEMITPEYKLKFFGKYRTEVKKISATDSESASYVPQLFVNKQKLKNYILAFQSKVNRFNDLNRKLLNEAGILYYMNKEDDPYLWSQNVKLQLWENEDAMPLNEESVETFLQGFDQLGDDLILEGESSSSTPETFEPSRLIDVKANGDTASFNILSAPRGSELDNYIRMLARYGVTFVISPGVTKTSNYGSFIGGAQVTLRLAEFIPYLAQTLKPTMTMYHEAQHAELTRTDVWAKKAAYSISVSSGIAVNEDDWIRIPLSNDLKLYKNGFTLQEVYAWQNHIEFYEKFRTRADVLSFGFPWIESSPYQVRAQRYRDAASNLADESLRFLQDAAQRVREKKAVFSSAVLTKNKTQVFQTELTAQKPEYVYKNKSKMSLFVSLDLNASTLVKLNEGFKEQGKKEYSVDSSPRMDILLSEESFEKKDAKYAFELFNREIPQGAENETFIKILPEANQDNSPIQRAVLKHLSFAIETHRKRQAEVNLYIQMNPL